MDPTLTQILSALYQKDAALQRAEQEIAALKAKVAELEALAAKNSVPPTDAVGQE